MGAKLVRDQLYDIDQDPIVDFKAIHAVVTDSFAKLNINGWYVNNLVSDTMVSKINYKAPTGMGPKHIDPVASAQATSYTADSLAFAIMLSFSSVLKLF